MRTATSFKLSSFFSLSRSPFGSRLLCAAAALALGVGLSACGAQSDDYVGEAFDCVGANGESLADHDVVVLVDQHQNKDVTGYFGSTFFQTGDAYMVMAELEDVDLDRDDFAFESEITLGDNRIVVEVELEFSRDDELEGDLVYASNGVDINCRVELERE